MPTTNYYRYLTVLRIINLSLLLMLITGCAGVTIREVSPKDQISKRRGDILTTGVLSYSSQEVLRILGQDIKSCHKTPKSCLNMLSAARGITEEQRLATLTELWLKFALDQDKKSTKTQQENNTDAWLEVTRYAYAYLFYSEREPNDRAFEDRQIQIRDYYNFAIQRSVSNLYRRYSRATQHKSIANSVTIDQWRIHTNLTDSTLLNNEIPSELISAESISFSAIRNVYRRDGFGTDLIAVMPYNNAITLKTSKKRTFIKQTYVPITALIQFKGKNLSEILNTQELTLTLFNPYKTSEVVIKGKTVPLTANFTANYGLWLARSGFAKQAVRNLFGREGAITQPQLYLMQPYDPNRNIVIMLHGLASSPEAWINLTNEILGDKKLRENYQIWIVYYPTNAPIAINNRDIRETLDYALKQLDPTGRHRASKNMTLIGHSMGGILSRLMMSDSKETWLQATLDKDTSLSSEKKAKISEKLRPYLVFTPMPEASSGIFIATPHQGTGFANNKIVRWVANLIYIPSNILKRVVGDEIAPDIIKIPNSIDNLSDQDPFLRYVATLPISPKVTYYSIIGNRTPNRPLVDSSDGIVPYSSSHLANACSETVINASHSVQETPEAILEIRRILTEQLNNQVKCQITQ